MCNRHVGKRICATLDTPICRDLAIFPLRARLSNSGFSDQYFGDTPYFGMTGYSNGSNYYCAGDPSTEKSHHIVNSENLSSDECFFQLMHNRMSSKLDRWRF